MLLSWYSINNWGRGHVYICISPIKGSCISRIWTYTFQGIHLPNISTVKKINVINFCGDKSSRGIYFRVHLRIILTNLRVFCQFLRIFLFWSNHGLLYTIGHDPTFSTSYENFAFRMDLFSRKRAQPRKSIQNLSPRNFIPIKSQ